MRRLIPYFVLLGIAGLAGGCAVSDYPGGPSGDRFPALSGANVSHQAVECGTYDKIPGLNTQQTWERGVSQFDRTAYPGAPGAFCNVTPIGQVSPDEAREWTRFIGPWGFQIELWTTQYGGCYDGLWLNSGLKGLDDDSVRLFTYRYTAAPTYRWTCASGSGQGMAGALGPEGMTLAQEVYYKDWPINVFNTKAPIGPYLVFQDPAPGVTATYGFGSNIVAVNDDESSANRCENCLSTFTAVGGRSYEGHLSKVATWGSAGLAEFFSGQPLTVTHRGVTCTASARMGDNGMTYVKVLSINKGSSVYTAQNPVEVGVDAKSLKRFTFDWTGQKPEMARLAQWALANLDLTKPIEIGGFVPELGITVPDAAFLLNEGAMRKFVANQTSGIEPKQRTGSR